MTGTVRERVRTWVERRRYGTYERVAGTNYRHRLVATPQLTPGGWIRSYELYNRHGRHAMLRELCAASGSADVVYDVGASVGIYALAVTADAPNRRVVAYEPAPPTVERLEANLAINECGRRVDVRPVGLGATSESRPFFVSSYPELSSFEREGASRWGANVATDCTVPVRRLDDEIDEYPAPDVLKVDAEGAAAGVFRGGRQTLATHEPLVFVEVHEEGFSGDRSATVREELESADYVVEERGGYWRCEPRA